MDECRCRHDMNYDLSVMSMSVMGVQKMSLDRGGWSFVCGFFQLCKAPNRACYFIAIACCFSLLAHLCPRYLYVTEKSVTQINPLSTGSLILPIVGVFGMSVVNY